MSFSTWLQDLWWRPRPTWAARALQPLAGLVQALAWLDQRRRPPQDVPRPVVVVGNLIVGGAGKTPTVLALIEALRALGWTPGVISRGYGRDGDDTLRVTRQTPARRGGDEPLLIHLRSGAPVCVGRDRVDAARTLVAAHPEVDLLLSDDGLQHTPLPRQAAVLVFDGRGVGNGLTLPAGPLRQPWTREVPPRSLVLYNAPQPSTAWPGWCASRALRGAVSLQDWWAGQAAQPQVLQQLAAQSRQQPVWAAAGLAQPERFFTMLEAQGLLVQRLPLPDHASWTPLPWPPGTRDVLVTEKDAVKLSPQDCGDTRVWVVTLDLHIPTEFIHALDALLRSGADPT